jgi:ComF family protein
MAEVVERWRRAALAALVEPWRAAAGGRCAVCRGWCDGALCRWCEARCASPRPRCRACGLPWPDAPGAPGAPGVHASQAAAEPRRCPRCPPEAPGWSQVVAGVDYGHPWDRLLAEFKFHGRIEHAHALLQPLRARLRADAAAAPPAGLRVLPVPLARERLRERGYNQAWELARRLAHGHGLAARADVLFRVRETGHQLGLPRAARRANLQGAFVVTPGHAAWVRGARLALVDDVMTTGATAAAAARALHAAGAAEVRVWVVARA